MSIAKGKTKTKNNKLPEYFDEGEVCDGTDLDGEDCVIQGFESGGLSCEFDCTSCDTSNCGFED